MNAEVVAIRHVHFEDLGSFEQVLGERGRRVRYVDVGGSRVEVLDALEPSLLVVLGGPISATTTSCIRRRRRSRRSSANASKRGCRRSASVSARS